MLHNTKFFSLNNSLLKWRRPNRKHYNIDADISEDKMFLIFDTQS